MSSIDVYMNKYRIKVGERERQRKKINPFTLCFQFFKKLEGAVRCSMGTLLYTQYDFPVRHRNQSMTVGLKTILCHTTNNKI